MGIMLRYSTGKSADGLLLSATDTTMRLVVPGLNETIEFRREGGQWFSEQDGPVEIESILWDGHTPLPAAGTPKVLAAGN